MKNSLFRSTTFFYFSLLLFCNSEAFAGFTNFLYNITKPQVNIDTSLYNQNSGVDSSDLAFYSAEMTEIWQNFIKTPEGAEAVLHASEQESFNISVLNDLNIQAAETWEQMVSCFGPDLKSPANLQAARAAYLEEKKSRRAFSCRQRNEVLQSIKALHLNVQGWLEQSGVDENFVRYTTKTDSLPLLHPLLGQVLMEAFSYYMMQAQDILGMPFINDAFPIDQLELSVSMMSCRDKSVLMVDGDPVDCEVIRKIARGTSLTTRLLSTAKKSCLTFGFWPNATLFLYSGTNIGRQGFSSHPILEKQTRKGYKLIDLFVSGGQGKMMIYYDDNGKEQHMLQAYSPLLEAALRVEMEVQYQKITAQSAPVLTAASCWQGKDAVLGSILAPAYNIDTHGSQRNEHVHIYDDLFRYYSDQK